MKTNSIKLLFFFSVLFVANKSGFADSLIENDVSQIMRDLYFAESNPSKAFDELRKLQNQGDLEIEDSAVLSDLIWPLIRSKNEFERDNRSHDDFIALAENSENLWATNRKIDDINTAINFYRLALYRKHRDVEARLALMRIYSELGMNQQASQWAFHFAENYFPNLSINPNDSSAVRKMRSITKWIFAHILSSENISDASKKSLLSTKEPALTMAYYFTKKANSLSAVGRYSEADHYTSAAFGVLASIDQLDVNNPSLVKELEKVSAQVSSKLENQKSIIAAKRVKLTKDREALRRKYDERLPTENETEVTKKQADSRALQKVSPKRIVVKILNVSQSKIKYFLRLGNSVWQNYTLDPGEDMYHYSDKNLSDIPEIFVYDNQLSPKFPEKKFEKRLKLRTLTTTVDEYENAQKNGSIPTYLLDTEDLGPLAPYEVIVIKDSKGKLINTYKK